MRNRKCVICLFPDVLFGEHGFFLVSCGHLLFNIMLMRNPSLGPPVLLYSLIPGLERFPGQGLFFQKNQELLPLFNLISVDSNCSVHPLPFSQCLGHEDSYFQSVGGYVGLF